jgi:hypothetical protein
LDYHNFSSHGISAALVMIDILFGFFFFIYFLDSFPMIWEDLTFVVIYGYGYLAFLFMYHSATGIWVYDILDPKKSSNSFVIFVFIVLCIAIVASYFIIKLFMFLKLMLFGFLKKTKNFQQEQVLRVEEHFEENYYDI